jgi:hypothetical protein
MCSYPTPPELILNPVTEVGPGLGEPMLAPVAAAAVACRACLRSHMTVAGVMRW